MNDTYASPEAAEYYRQNKEFAVLAFSGASNMEPFEGVEIYGFGRRSKGSAAGGQ